ncbi:uncharacterized protein LOC112351239 [Selaginella moellendorffii]|uniref:uncharacterized protein LOC112351239 n=1 Tax=Selaginella moellendorffii TaxID=88036 RepID=UPI000D1C4627|nr:uncharacterized protein LOC112351239 [Selaginella moellendorffii]|eukprot:XP_024544503.1 uncharacterized protein LOC112351239 [Selaginella moellendorffii]
MALPFIVHDVQRHPQAKPYRRTCLLAGKCTTSATSAREFYGALERGEITTVLEEVPIELWSSLSVNFQENVRRCSIELHRAASSASGTPRVLRQDPSRQIQLLRRSG